MVNTAYVFWSVPWSQRIPISCPWWWDFLIPFFLSIHWPFHSSDSSVSVFADWQCRSQCVFSSFCTGPPLAGNINVDTLICLVITSLHTFFMKNPICVSSSHGLPCMRELGRLLEGTNRVRCSGKSRTKELLTGYGVMGRAREFGGWRMAVKWIHYSLSCAYNGVILWQCGKLAVPCLLPICEQRMGKSRNDAKRSFGATFLMCLFRAVPRGARTQT